MLIALHVRFSGLYQKLADCVLDCILLLNELGHFCFPCNYYINMAKTFKKAQRKNKLNF